MCSMYSYREYLIEKNTHSVEHYTMYRGVPTVFHSVPIGTELLWPGRIILGPAPPVPGAAPTRSRRPNCFGLKPESSLSRGCAISKREAELKAIAEFLKTRGATCCGAAYATVSCEALTPAKERKRLISLVNFGPLTALAKGGNRVGWYLYPPLKHPFSAAR